MAEPTYFERSVPAGIVGLVHMVAGFLGTLLAVVKIALYGPVPPAGFGIFYVVFNYLYQLTPVLLWVSGIGILRARRWGAHLAAAWACSVLLLVPAAYGLRLRSFGLLAPDPGWALPFVLGYALATLAVVYRNPLLGLLRSAQRRWTPATAEPASVRPEVVQ